MTKSFTYEVNLVVQVLAEDEESANKKVDVEGGFVSARKRTLIATTDLPSVLSEETK